MPPQTTEFRSELRESDAEAVARIVTHTGVFSAAEIEIARSLVEETRAGLPGADYRFLFMDGANGLDAYTCFGPIPGTQNRYELYWIAVDPSARRRGLGQALIAETERAVRALHGTHLFAHTSTRADYIPARAFYVAHGYIQHADIPDYYSDGDGMAIYGKRL
ncbi:MAG: GNAT family N-acetyltransferase [Pseudomonadota bacterium]|nr:GNAT family N-acetyltransferase [Pseudomonadota bacterium]